MTGVPVDLPRVARDVRVTGANGGGRTEQWRGVGRRFGGLLRPGLEAGAWPPPALSHLTLGALLADALDPAVQDGSSGSDAGRSDESERPAEPTVREVVRRDDGASEADPPDGDDRTSRVDASWPRRTTLNPVVDRSGDGSSGGVDGTAPRDDPASGADGDRSDARLHGDRSGASDRGGGSTGRERRGTTTDPPATPRTVVRRAGRAAAPATASERRITKLVTPDESGAADDEGAGGDGASPASLSASWPVTPVERTMPTVPPDVGPGRDTGAAPTVPTVAADAGGGTARPGDGSAPASAGPGDTDAADPAAGDARAASGEGTPPEAPTMRVRRDPAGTGGGGRSTADTPPATERGNRGEGAAGSVRPDAGSDGRVGGDAGADASGTTDDATEGADDPVQRAVAAAVSEPRVVDRLARELERRRRIERERGGRR